MNKFSKHLGSVFILFFIGVFAFFVWKTSQNTSDRSTLLFVIGDNKAESLVKATDLFYKENPHLAKKVEVIIRTRSNSNNGLDPIPHSDIMVVKVSETPMLEAHLDYIDKANKMISSAGMPKARIAIGDFSAKYPEEDLSDRGMIKDKQIDQYYKNESPEELKKMLVYLLNKYSGYSGLKVEKPSPILESGFVVYKNGKVEKLVKTWEEWHKYQKPNPNKDKVAILIYESAAKEGILNIEGAIYKNLEEKGVQPVFVFGYPSSKAMKNTVIDTLKLQNKGIKAAISWFYKFPDNDAEKVLPLLDIPLINAIDIYGKGIKDWKSNQKGLSSTEVAWQIAIPELAGMIQPTVVGGVELKEGIPYKKAIPSRVDRVVDRALRFVKLQKIDNKNKKIAFVYWNYPPGKDNIGASYLNIFESYPIILQELQKQGYYTGNYHQGQEAIFKKLIKERGRNVGKYAPGELQKLVNSGGAILIPVSTYKKWFNTLDKEYRLQITNHWGQPEKADIMTIHKNGELHFVLPAIQYGNVYFMPQADRARTQDLAALYHSQTLPPHHQYICQYLWFQHNMDAIVHTGTHGTHEWLDGKESGLSDTDSPEVLAGDLPIFYIYNMDVVGEGVQAKRRGAATIIDHLTPSLGEAGMTPEMKNISALLRQWETTKALNPDGVKPLLEMIDAEATKMGIKKDLEKDGWGANKSLQNESMDNVKDMIEALQHHIEEIRERATPFGFHTFGKSPQGERLERFAQIMAKTNGMERKQEFIKNLSKSGEEELKMLIHGLNGRFVPAQVGNDPIRNPNAIPTGRNFYTFDPRTIPTPYSDSIGRILANNYIRDFKKNNGKNPSKVAFEVWAVETIRHQGVQEAQILALLGVRLKRNKRGHIEGVELIPREELGRPRVDVVMSSTGLYRDTFPMFFELLDEAFKLAAESPEEDNPVRKNSEKLRLDLIRAGVSDEDARLRSQIRIFAEPSGTYGSKMNEAIASSGSWENETQLAELYIRRMGNGYGKGYWGESMEKEYKAALSGVESVIHSRSSSVYMSLDNDDFFAYAGAIAMGVRYVDKTQKSPDVMVADLHTKGNEQIKSLEKYMGQELRSRYFNPEYIKEMKKEGYSGARHIMQGVEFLWGWQVVYPEVVNDEKWQEFYDVWLKDKYDLGTDEFWEQNSPHAKETITARMMEAVRKGYWNPNEEVKKDLSKMYVENVVKHGVSCGHTSCNHAELTDFIKGVALSNANIKNSDIDKMIKKVENATGKSITEAKQQQVSDRKNYADPKNIKDYNPKEKPKYPSEKGKTGTQKVQGYKMVEEKIIEHHSSDKKGAEKQKGVEWFVPLIIALMGGCIVLGGLERHFYK